MRPSETTDGNLERPHGANGVVCASMRPSETTDGNAAALLLVAQRRYSGFNEAVGNYRRKHAGLRKTPGIQAAIRRFNEAVGNYRRKRSLVETERRRVLRASMRPSETTDGNVRTLARGSAAPDRLQ